MVGMLKSVAERLRSGQARVIARWLVIAAIVVSAGRYIYRNVVRPLRQWESDFIALYCGARAVVHGTNPYDMSVRRECYRQSSPMYAEMLALYERNVQIILEAGGTHSGSLDAPAYLNPPQFAYLMAPLASLSSHAASICWLALNHLWYLGGLLLLWRTLRPRIGFHATGLVVCAGLNCLAAYGFFVRYQSSGLLFVTLVAAIAAFLAGRDGVASVAMFLSLVVKPYIGAPLCLLWWAWGRRRLVGLVTVLVILSTLLSALGIGLPALRDYVFREIPAAFTEQTEDFWETNVLTPSFFALTSRYLPASRTVTRSVAILLSLCLAGATIAALRHVRSAGRGSWHAMGIVVCTAVLVAPYNRVYDMVILWIPILFLLADWKSWSRESWIPNGGLVAVLLAFTLSFHATVYTMVCGCLWLLELLALKGPKPETAGA
jgi:hypothetical protein